MIRYKRKTKPIEMTAKLIDFLLPKNLRNNITSINVHLTLISTKRTEPDHLV